MTKIHPDTYFMKYQRKILELKNNRMLFHSSTMNTSKSVYSINYECTVQAAGKDVLFLAQRINCVANC